MTTYTFSELDKRGQEAVALRYDQLIMEELSKGDELETADSMGEPEILDMLFRDLAWRFSANGERVA